MFLSQQDIGRMERRYGVPAVERMSFEMGEQEWVNLRGSQLHGRAHDVTLFVFHRGRLAVIAKHNYPPGLYRAPSGGVLPGESMARGIAREMMEETGLKIRLQRYVLRVHVDFTRRKEKIAWTTHVFTGERIAGRIRPRDTQEIREARWADLGELAGDVREKLLGSGSAGLRYRALLHDRVMQEVGRVRGRASGETKER
jgi:ADP-ribose pyrophosphatase YjhB (NUDIX family)